MLLAHWKEWNWDISRMDKVQLGGPGYGLALVACAEFDFEVAEVKTGGSFAHVENLANFPRCFSVNPPGKALPFSWGELGWGRLDEFMVEDKLMNYLMQVVGQDIHHAASMNVVS
jgi:hypothetical protein